MRRLRLWLPLAVFVGLVALIGLQLLRPADRIVRSAMIGKPLPAFALPPIVPGKPGLASAAFRGGRPRLLNMFASWCVPCEAEAPQLMRLKQLGIPIEAVAVRDSATDLRGFLARNGDPYQAIGDDQAMRVQLALGSSGVPETFVIGADGAILLQHVGAIRDEDVAEIARAAGVAG